MGGKDTSIQTPNAQTHFRDHGWATGPHKQLQQKIIGQTLISEDIANISGEILIHHWNHLFSFEGIGYDGLYAAHNIVILMNLGEKLAPIT
jgi:hypothetical protein